MGNKDSVSTYKLNRRSHIYIVVLVISFLIFLPYVINDLDIKNPFEKNIDNPGHYNLLFAITTPVGALQRRKILREALFGIKDNLEPCMHQDGNVYYEFLVEPYKSVDKLVFRDFIAESIEYGDIKEFPNVKGQDFQESILKWAQDLNKKGIEYNYLVIINDKTLINLEKLQKVLEGSIHGNVLTKAQKRTLVWGSFMTLHSDNMAIVLGRDAIATILNSKNSIEVINSNFTNTITRVFQYYQEYPDSGLYPVNDDVGIIEFPNAVENVPIEKTIAVGHLFLEEDLKDLIDHLSIPKTLICHHRNNQNKLNIAVVTSSYVYGDLCMLPAARATSDNKRDYAKKHGYSFVARSAEFTQQEYKRRKTVWGKLDVIEKLLPHYDWIFWLDMDTVIMNHSITAEQLFNNFTEMVGGRNRFEEKHLIVARPKNDRMINAGVFFIRNSEWSRDFLRLVQSREDLYFGTMYEQHAMWDVIQQPEWAPGTLLLDQDDHTFNTFPSRYVRGDFVVHYAPDSCPAKPIIDAVIKMKLLEKNPDMEISLDHTRT